MKWSELKYWQSGDWQAVEEHLDDEATAGRYTCPPREALFKALDLVPFEKVRVCIIGQDPYPDRRFATGVAFSIPKHSKEFPPSLVNIFAELHADLGVDIPRSGELTRWCKQGVLLWNAVPSCREGLVGSHHWDEWRYLTKEIVERLDEKGSVVFVLLGRCARANREYIVRSPCIETSHPSPLGAKWGFLGSRIFSRVNEALTGAPIDWRLP